MRQFSILTAHYLSSLSPILCALDDAGDASTHDIHRAIAVTVGAEGDQYAEVGKSKQSVKPICWVYQSLKREGLINSKRRRYSYLTGTGKTQLTAIKECEAMEAFRPVSVIFLWADATAVAEFEATLSLICVSPPY